MRFSRRTAWQPGVNEWTAAVVARRVRGEFFDLTVSNPTLCGLGPDPDEVLAPLQARAALQYRPDALGMVEARTAVAAYYRDHECAVAPDRICVTTSTSEAYSFLLRLLCDPGDEVLIATPSYPLFDLLAEMEDVVLREYPLFYEPGAGAMDRGAWALDRVALEAEITERTRALIVVHPNNPTGHYTSESERAFLVKLCAERGLALIVDEVFLDYALLPEPNEAQHSFASVEACLCFVLSGLSKICALPQMKASWIVTCGPAAIVAEAMHRLEIIADTFLSMNAPVQNALPSWLGARHRVQRRVQDRIRLNVGVLDKRLEGSLGDRLALEGGWTAVLRVPRTIDDQTFALAALEKGVLVQPGTLYGLSAGRCVLSLLTVPEVWARGLACLPL